MTTAHEVGGQWTWQDQPEPSPLTRVVDQLPPQDVTTDHSMNINPFKHIISHLRSHQTTELSSTNEHTLKHPIEAQVTHIKQSAPPPPLGQNSTSPGQFIVTVTANSKPMDILTDLPLRVGETLTLATDAQGKLHLIDRMQPPQREQFRALIADLANRQDSLIPLLKTVSTIVNSAIVTPLTQLTAIQRILNNPLSETQLKTLAATIKTNLTSLPISSTTKPTMVPTDTSTTINEPLATSPKAIKALLNNPRWPDLMATILALHQAQTQRFTNLTTTNLKTLLQELTPAASLTLTTQISTTNSNHGFTHTFTTLLFRLVALLEVASVEAAVGRRPEAVVKPWYTSWHSLHPKGWAPSLPEVDIPHLPWLPPVTQLHPISPRSQSSPIPTPNWLEGFIKVLIHQSAAALARLTTHHLLHQQNRHESGPTITQFEIPLQWQGQWTQANLHIREDHSKQPHAPNQQDQSHRWSLNLGFNLEHIGIIVVQFTLHSQVSRGTVWIEKANTFNIAQSAFQHFLDQLKLIGVHQRAWTIQQGLPPDQSPPVNNRLVDIKT